MLSLCKYRMCQNLGSSLYDGYCNEEHMKRGPEMDILMKIIYTHKGISTVKEARHHRNTYLTFSSHCEECKGLLHE